MKRQKFTEDEFVDEHPAFHQFMLPRRNSITADDDQYEVS
jgi:hypothetical protein